MSATVIKPSHIDFSNIKFSSPKINKPDPTKSGGGLGKSINMYYNDTILKVQFPMMSLPFSMSDNYNKDGYEFCLTFRDMDENSGIKKLYKFFEDFDEFIIQSAIANSDAWLGVDKHGKTLTEEVIRSKHNSLFKISKKPGYAPNCVIKIPQDNSTKHYNFSVFGPGGEDDRIHINPISNKADNGEEVDIIGLEDLLTANSKVIVILQMSSVWVTTAGFGITKRLQQMQVFNSSNKISGFSIQPDSDNENYTVDSDKEQDEVSFEKETSNSTIQNPRYTDSPIPGTLSSLTAAIDSISNT